jgi:hypothetical protein
MREIPQLSAKLLVELANGLIVTADHVQTQAERTRILRLVDVVTGQGRRRRLAVDTSTASQMQVIVSYLKELDRAGTTSMIAIEKVAASVATLARRSHSMGDAIVDLAEDLNQVRTSACERLSEMRSEIARLGREVVAHRHLDLEIDRWGAGRLPGFSPIQKLFLTVDALYWGAFGDQVRELERPEKVAEWADFAKNKLVQQLTRTLGAEPTPPLPAHRWLASEAALPADASAAVAFLAEPSNRYQPLSRMVSTGAPASDPDIPGFVSIHRGVDRMFEEVFVRRTFV